MEEIVVGIDVGTTKICTLVGRVEDDKSIRILGVGIVGHGAGELIGEGAVAVEMGATVDDLAAIVHPHPTLSETLMESAEVFFGHATHVFTKKKPDAPAA